MRVDVGDLDKPEEGLGGDGTAIFIVMPGPIRQVQRSREERATVLTVAFQSDFPHPLGEVELQGLPFGTVRHRVHGVSVNFEGLGGGPKTPGPDRYLGEIRYRQPRHFNPPNHLNQTGGSRSRIKTPVLDERADFEGRSYGRGSHRVKNAEADPARENHPVRIIMA